MQTEMFPKQFQGPKSITLEIRGQIPSHKNNKMLVKPSLSAVKLAIASGNFKALVGAVMAWMKKPVLLITKPEYQRRMETMIADIESQLSSASQIVVEPTCPINSTHSWIALSLPADDCWTKLPEIHIRGELCAPGNEGATIHVERIL
jgi:hypothetical protein